MDCGWTEMDANSPQKRASTEEASTGGHELSLVERAEREEAIRDVDERLKNVNLEYLAAIKEAAVKREKGLVRAQERLVREKEEEVEEVLKKMRREAMRTGRELNKLADLEAIRIVDDRYIAAALIPERVQHEMDRRRDVLDVKTDPEVTRLHTELIELREEKKLLDPPPLSRKASTLAKKKSSLADDSAKLSMKPTTIDECKIQTSG